MGDNGIRSDWDYKRLGPKAARLARVALAQEYRLRYRALYERRKLQGSSKASSLAYIALTHVYPERYRELYNQFKQELIEQEANA